MYLGTVESFEKLMATVQVTANITLESEQLLEACSQLDLVELERIYSSLGKVLKQRKSEMLSPSSLHTAAEEVATEAMSNTIPIVEKFIPASITLDGDSFSF